MRSAVITALRTCLVLIFLGALFVQLFALPVTADEFARSAPDVAYLRWPMLVIWIVVVMCVEVAVVAIWCLLNLVDEDDIFQPAAFRWVDVVIWCGAVATVIALGVAVYLTFLTTEGAPFILLGVGGVIVAGSTLTLLMVVMRTLLRKATELESELVGVV